MVTVSETQLDGLSPLVARGKVRDIYEVDEHTSLFVATDRISAYDVIMENTIPDKGVLLTKSSEFWFEFSKDEVRNHLIAIPQGKTVFDLLPAASSQDKYRSQSEGRASLVRKHKSIPLEVIVRGFITGSAWKEYKAKGTVHTLPQPAGLQESQEFPQPIFTPSTKAEQGEHDENISPDQAAESVGEDSKNRIEQSAIRSYSKCKEYAKTKGIIIADTKFEFGYDDKTDEIILVDEVLTPDSSRFWNGENYAIGKSQDSYDKQFLRDWSTSNDLNGKPGVKMPEDIVTRTRAKYVEAFEALTGEKWQ